MDMKVKANLELGPKSYHTYSNSINVKASLSSLTTLTSTTSLVKKILNYISMDMKMKVATIKFG